MTLDRKISKTITPKTGKYVENRGENVWNYTFTFADLVNLRTQTGFLHSFLELFLKAATGIIQVAEFQLISYKTIRYINLLISIPKINSYLKGFF